MIYLASPYSHPLLKIRQLRAKLAGWAAGILMMRGKKIFSPIAHTVFIHICGKTFITDTFEFWMEQDLEILRHCDELYVLMLPGWEDSLGVSKEIEFALELGISITYCHPDMIWLDNELWKGAA